MVVARQVLQAALDALPSLSEAELPPAVGLVLKLASQSDRARPAAVQAVRKRLEAAGSAVSAGTLDAVRLAVQQHPTIAAAFFADIDEGLRTAQGQPPGRGRGKHLGEEGPASSSSRSQVPLGHVKGGQPNPSTFGTYRGMPQGAVDSSSAAHVADVEGTGSPSIAAGDIRMCLGQV